MIFLKTIKKHFIFTLLCTAHIIHPLQTEDTNRLKHGQDLPSPVTTTKFVAGCLAAVGLPAFYYLYNNYYLINNTSLEILIKNLTVTQEQAVLYLSDLSLSYQDLNNKIQSSLSPETLSLYPYPYTQYVNTLDSLITDLTYYSRAVINKLKGVYDHNILQSAYIARQQRTILIKLKNRVEAINAYQDEQASLNVD